MRKDQGDLYDDETVERRRLYLMRSEDGTEDEYLRIQNRRKRYEKKKINPKAVSIMVLILAAMSLFYVIWQESKPIIDDLVLRIYGAPQSIREFVVKYPEAKSYIREYRRYKDNKLSTDVSDEVEEGTIPLFIQWDPRWGYRTYGSDYFGITGCGPTSLSMVICGLTGQTQYDPFTVSEWAMKKDYYVDGVGSSWDMMESGAEEFGLKVESLGDDIDRMVDALEQGKCVICSVSEGDFTYAGHFIVLTSIDNDSRIHLNDPNSPGNSSRAWSLSRLRKQIVSMWSYEKAPAPKKKKSGKDTGKASEPESEELAETETEKIE